MTFDWAHFTPWPSFAGGLLIGLAAAILVLLNGRIAGVSGILGGLVSARPGEIGWRFAFIGGLLVAPAVVRLVAALPAPRMEAGFAPPVVAGLAAGLRARHRPRRPP